MKYLRPVRRDLFDEMLDNMFDPFFAPTRSNAGIMKTDITEMQDSYLMEIDLAGYAKENIALSLEKGYLTVTATDKHEEEKKEQGYICRERSFGTKSRSYYVGDISEKDISAKYEQGVLTLEVKKESQKLAQAKQISIQ